MSHRPWMPFGTFRASLAIVSCLVACSALAASSAEAQHRRRRPPTNDTPVVQPSPAPEASPATASHDDEARLLFQAGRSAFADGRFRDALDLFERAYGLSHRGGMLYNIGQSADRVRQDERALEAFEQYLREEPNANNRSEVESRITVLRAAVAERRQREAADRANVTPRAAALAGEGQGGEAGPLDASGAEGHAASSGSIFGKWWFWVAVVAVAGAATAGVVVATSGTSTNALRTGSDGQVVTALEAR